MSRANKQIARVNGISLLLFFMRSFELQFSTFNSPLKNSHFPYKIIESPT